jgi:glutamate formiminotransferase
VLVGVRPPLVAFNIDLATDDVEIARAIASAIRERDGGLAGVQALGLRAHGRAQVSTNLIDVEGTPLAAVVSAVDRLAGEHGTTIAGSELVGLMPARIAASAAASALRLPSLPVERLLEVAVAGEFGATQL